MSLPGTLSAPQRLNEQHVLADFDCGKAALNTWLQSHAWTNQQADYTKVMVVASGKSVVGYYGLSLSSVHRDDVPRQVRKHPAPKDIPCLLLGQLAVDHRWKGRGIGGALLRDALIRALTIAGHAGTRAVVVNALDDDACRFWAGVGFLSVPKDPSTFYRRIEDIRATLGAAMAQSTR
ncbi:MAG: GNAT family N-acetyltransferase [Rhodanobacter sp.]